MSDTERSAAAAGTAVGGNRYRLNRAGIHNVWQYDDHVFHFADGRLLLRGRNGAGKSKALEMLLPFLLDGDARRLDTTGNSRTSLRWLMLDGRPESAAPSLEDGEEGVPETVLGYLWVEFTGRGGDGAPVSFTLGAGISANALERDARPLFFVTERRVGEDLVLVDQGRLLPIERLPAEVGADNCYESAAGYRARVMRELFGLEDPTRYRNLVHLLYRLRRPTIGERIEAGELATVLAEALPPTDETVLDTVARNLADLDSARTRLAALRSAESDVNTFLEDYRGYLRGVLRQRARAVREQIDAYDDRAHEAAQLAEELDELLTAESRIQEDRERSRRTRDTAAADIATLDAAGGEEKREAPRPAEEPARQAVIGAHISAAESAAAAAEHALAAERQSQEQISADVAAITRRLRALRGANDLLRTALQEAGTAYGHDVPGADHKTLAPRESATHVDIEGWERAVERDPVVGIDETVVRGSLARLYDELTGLSGMVEERGRLAAELRTRCRELRTEERRAAGRRDEAEWLDSRLEHAGKQEHEAGEAVRSAGSRYAAQVREWADRIREAGPHEQERRALSTLEEYAELALDAERPFDPAVPGEVARRAEELVAPMLAELRERRDTAVGEQRELTAELDELADRRSRIGDHVAPPRPRWADEQDGDLSGVPLYLAVDFAPGLTSDQQAGLEAALEASGLLTARLTTAGSVLDGHGHELSLRPGEPVRGESLSSVLQPTGVAGAGADAVAAVLGSIRLSPAGQAEEAAAASSGVVSLDGRWSLGAAHGRHTKPVAEYVGQEARERTRERHLAELDRRIAIAEALLAEAGERRSEVEEAYARLAGTLREVPGGEELAAARAVAESARTARAEAEEDASAARSAADAAHEAVLASRREIERTAAEHELPTGVAELSETLSALDRARAHLTGIYRDLETLAGQLDRYRADTAAWERLRSARIVAEDARAEAIQEMIIVRRDIELSGRAHNAGPEQIEAARAEVRTRLDGAADRLPELERAAQQARDDRVAAEARHGIAVRERARQARRVVAVGARLCAPLGEGEPDRDLATAAGLGDLADAPDSPLPACAAGEEPDGGGEADAPADDTGRLETRLAAVRALTEHVETALGEDEGAEALDDSALLSRYETLHRRLATAGIGARAELAEPAGVKRVRVHDEDGTHDVVGYAARLRQAITAAEETALLREEEAYERHLLGELAAHLFRQITEARALISSMNRVLGEVTTSQGLGVRLEWSLASDADEDITAMVPLLERPPAERTRLETTQLRDALRRSIEAIRRLDPSASQGAQLRAALDYRSWFAFTVYVTDGRQGERRLTHRTALSQGEQRVVAYLVLFVAAAAQFGELGRSAPRLILLDDAFAKVDEPTHGRLMGLLVELDLDFVLTSERLWGCFSDVPSLHIYECLRDSSVPGIATLHFTWDGERRRLRGV